MKRGANWLGYFEMFSDFLKNVVTKAQDIVYYTGQKLLEFFYAGALFVAGGIFVCIAVVFLMEQYLLLSTGWGMLIVGLFLILFGMTVKNKASKMKYYR